MREISCEYCQQCAALFNYGDSVFRDVGLGKPPLRPGAGYPLYCGGCGPTWTDGNGVCIGACEHQHGTLGPRPKTPAFPALTPMKYIETSDVHPLASNNGVSTTGKVQSSGTYHG